MSADRQPAPFHREVRQRIGQSMAMLIGVMLLSLTTATPLFAANPPPVQIFYLPVPEDQAFDMFESIYPGNEACNLGGFTDVAEPIITYDSISVLASDTIIYFDHWEDGYEVDLANPVQDTTEIWGDGALDNGVAPGDADDLLQANSVIVLTSTVTSATRQLVIDFDGSDKFGASRTIAVTRVLWPSGPRTLQAGALEVYPVSNWGRTFHAPVGTNVMVAEQLFEESFFAVMAAEDDTLVEVDGNADGIFELSTTLNEGQSYLSPDTVRQGASVQSNKPVQVALITGDRCDVYETRWFSLFDDTRLSNRYYSPVSTRAGNSTTAYLYNPNNVAITVTRTITGNAQLVGFIEPGQGTSFRLPDGSAARFDSANGEPFAGVAAIDTDDTRIFNSLSDWGFTLIPSRAATMQTLIGLGIGRDPESTADPEENASPVWVTPIFANGDTGTMSVCVDFDGDGVGPLTDANGFNYDLRLELAEFEIAKVLDDIPDDGIAGDQTGMLLYVCPITEGAAVTGRIVAAWGQDPALASTGPPGLDAGTTAPPAATFEAGKSALLINDLDGDNQADPGDSLRYNVLVRNNSRVPIGSSTLSDTVPLYTAYIPGSTTLDIGSGISAVDDNGAESETAFPLDEGGIALGTLDVGAQITVTFDVTIDQTVPEDVDRVRNVAIVRLGDEESRPEVETPLDDGPLIVLQKTTNGVDGDIAPGVTVRSGTEVTWSYTITNTSDVSVTNLALVDSSELVTPTFVTGDLTNTGILDPGEAWLYEASGVAVTGQYSNTATAVGLDVDGDGITVTDVSHYFGLVSSIVVTKQASSETVLSSEVVTYSYGISNTGNGPLVNVTATDDRCTPVIPDLAEDVNVGDSNQDAALDVGELWTYSCTSPLTTTTTNLVTVMGVDVLSETVSATASATVTVVGAVIELDKVAASRTITRGDTAYYTVTVTNPSLETLSDVNVVDSLCTLAFVDGDSGEDGLLSPGESWRYTCSQVLSQTTTNMATVTALDPSGTPVTATDRVKVVVPLYWLPIIITPPVDSPCPAPDGCPLTDEIKAFGINQSGSRLYISTRNADELLLVDPLAVEILARTSSDIAQPWGVVVDEADNRVYVSNYTGASVSIYDATTLALIKTIPVGDNPTLLEIVPSENLVFALVRGGSKVAVIQGTDLVEIVDSGGSGPFGMAYDSVNQRLFVSHRDSQSMWMLRKENGSWQAFPGPKFDDGRQLFELAYDEATQRLFVVYADLESNWLLDVWEPNNNTLWGRFSTQAIRDGGNISSPDVGGAAVGLDVVAGKLFIVNTAANSLSVIDTTTLGELNRVGLGNDPFALAIDNALKRLYVGLRESGRLVKLDGAY